MKIAEVGAVKYHSSTSVIGGQQQEAGEMVPSWLSLEEGSVMLQSNRSPVSWEETGLSQSDQEPCPLFCVSSAPKRTNCPDRPHPERVFCASMNLSRRPPRLALFLCLFLFPCPKLDRCLLPS